VEPSVLDFTLLHYKKLSFLRFPIGWSDDLEQNLGLRFFFQTRKTRIDEKKYRFGFGFRFRSGNHFRLEKLGAKGIGKLHLRFKNWKNKNNCAIEKDWWDVLLELFRQFKSELYRRLERVVIENNYFIKEKLT
jgi:hypothetical protein